MTTGKEWRQKRKEGVAVELPSGMTPLLRGIGFGLLLRSGVVPDYLTDTIVRASMGETMEQPPPPDATAAQERLEFIDEIARQMFVSPRIVPAPTDDADLADDEITIDDVMDVDKLFLVQMVGSPTAWLAKFHGGQSASLAHLLFEQGLPDAAEPVPETGTDAAGG